MNSKLRTETKNDFEKYFFKLMNNAVFRKTQKKSIIFRDYYTKKGFQKIF